MEERLRFVARLLEGEGMSELCREFGISRKTGYNIFNRYKDDGLEALSDRSRRPVRYANQLPDQIERLIVTCKREKRDHHGRDARSRLQKYVLSQPIAARSLEELSFRDLRGWLEELESSDALKPASCGRLLNDFCAALNRTLSSDPDSFPLIAERVRNALKSPPDAAAHLPVGELCVMDDRRLARLLAAAREIDAAGGWEGDLYRLVLLLAATGARFSQLAQLKVANLQIDNKRLMLPVSRKGSRGKSQVPIAYPLRDEVIAA